MFDSNAQELLSTSIMKIFRNSLAEIPAKLLDIPSTLILMAPRLDRKIRAYKYIIPDREIVIDDQTLRVFCQGCKVFISRQEMNHRIFHRIDGFQSTKESNGDRHYQFICDTCMRARHTTNNSVAFTGGHVTMNSTSEYCRLRLSAVMCIEKSHYVAFARKTQVGVGYEWLFFDSMSDRVGNNYNIPSVTRVPNFDAWLDRAENDAMFFQALDERRNSGQPERRTFSSDELQMIRLFRDGALFFYESI